MYEDRYAGRNPFYAPPRPLVDVAREQGETVDRQIVHRISPEDPWRRVRNRWRAEGAGPPPQPPTYLIGSSGVTLYRGTAFPPEYRQDVFIGIAGNNLVHHRRLVPDGVGFRARRLPDESAEEFLASTDLWFRPVAFANGPDGALYIADLYREILDFSDGIPESIKRFKDLNRGNDRGRIYRVVPDGFKQPALPKLGRASTAELARSPSALGRLHALCALDGLDALAESYVLHALADPEPAVKEHGVRLSERIIAARGLSDTLWQQLKARAEDGDPRVRYQLAFTLGEIRREEATDVLLALIKKDVELPWMHVAALSSLADGAGEVFTRLRDTPGFGRAAPDQALLKELIRVIGHRNKGRELLAVLNLVGQIADPSVTFAYVSAFADGLQRADVPLALFQPTLQPVFDCALTEARNSKAPESLRIQAIDLLGVTASPGETRTLLFSLVGTAQPRALQSAAIAALGRLDDPGVAKDFLARWPGFTPLLKREVMPVLLSRPDRALTIVEAVKTGTILRNELTPTQIAGLRAHRSPAVRTLAASVFEAPASADRRVVIDRYRPSLDLRGSAVRGATTFKAKCAACHQPGSDGSAVGPAVEALKVFGKEEVLTHLLDPNRTVDARYRLYQIDASDGASLVGIIQNESENSVTVRQPFGTAQTLPRSRIARLQALERSIMPDGLEEGLSLQDMADLLQFIAGTPAQDR
jgi:putative heme-binding domain-containing protein